MRREILDFVPRQKGDVNFITRDKNLAVTLAGTKGNCMPLGRLPKDDGLRILVNGLGWELNAEVI